MRTSLQQHHVPEVELGALVLALDEMCSNLMIHAHHCNPAHFITLKIFTTDPGTFVFEFTDDGELFDINRFDSPELDHIIQEKRRGGLGIRLVKSIMDSIEYGFENGQNVCRLTKKTG